MTKTLKWLGGGIAAAMLLGLAGLFSAEVADAQPSAPPHRYSGSVSIDGEPAAAGTSVVAVIDGAECGSGTVRTGADGSSYTINVPSDCAEEGDTVNFRVGGYDAAEHATWTSGRGTSVDLTAASMMGDDDDGMDECPDDMAGDGMDDGMGDDDMGGDAPPEPDLGMGDDDADMGDDDMGDGMGDDDMADDCPDDGTGDGDGDMGDGDGDMGDGDGDMGEDDDDGMTVGPAGTGLATGSSTSLGAILGLTALAIVLGGYTYARRRS
jgi:hypothetical protein